MNLLTLWPWPLNSKTVGYHKVIPYIKFEHFEIIRFWVVPDKQTNKQTDWLEHPTHANQNSQSG